MYRNKRTSSCPNFTNKPSRRFKKEVLNNTSLLQLIRRRFSGRWPRLFGHPIKLTDFFAAVVSRGGYKRVCDLRLWTDIAKELNLPVECGNASIGLRRIYFEFLSSYEVKEYPDLSEQYLVQTMSDCDGICEAAVLPATSVERNLGIGQNTPENHASLTTSQSLGDIYERTARANRCINYNDQGYSNVDKTYQDNREHTISTSRNGLHDPQCAESFSDIKEVQELRLAELALCSGLSNEVEVALNSLLVLSITPSSSGSSTSIRLAHCTNLLSLLLASVGVYGDGLGSYVLCDDVWKQQSKLNFLKFWCNTVRDPTGRLFLRPDVFINADITSDEFDPPDVKVARDLFAPFCLDDSDKFKMTDDLEISRVLLVSTILVNLITPPPINQLAVIDEDDDDLDFGPLSSRSLTPNGLPLATWRENERIIASNPSAIRFILLCAYSQHSGLKSLGLQLLSSLRFPLHPPICPLPFDCPQEWTPLIDSGCQLSRLSISFLTHCILENQDRAGLIAGLLFLANLAKVPNKINEDSLLNHLPAKIWPRFAQLICLPDLGVVCASLETLRCLTNLGKSVCWTCWFTCIDEEMAKQGYYIPLLLLRPLLALITLEGQAMGSQSLHRIRLMQRRPHKQSMFTGSSSQHSHGSSGSLYRQSVESVRIRDEAQIRHRLLKSVNHPTAIQPDFSRRHMESPYRYRGSLNSYYTSPSSIHPTNLEVQYSSCQPNPSIFRQPSPVYRSPSTSCTGLINLLSSPSWPSDHSTSQPSLNSFQTFSPPNSSSPSRSNFSNSSLSEITDRLQMPPPSLPPPSALRRSAKLAIPRVSSAPVNSPLNKTKANSYSLSPPKTTNTSLNSVVNERQSFGSMEFGVVNDLRSSIDSTTEECANSRNLDTVAKTEPWKPNIQSDSFLKEVYRQSDSRPTLNTCFAKEDSLISQSLPKQLDLTKSSETKYESKSTSLINGKNDSDDKNKVELNGKIQTFNNLNSVINNRTNGLKLGLLEAAVTALDNKKIISNSIVKSYSEPHKSLPIQINGVLEKSSMMKSFDDVESKNDFLSKKEIDQHNESPLYNSNSSPKLLNGFLNENSTEKSTTSPVSLNGNLNCINNENNNNNNNSDISNNNDNNSNNNNNCEKELNSTTKQMNLKMSIKLLKRRRKWGSRNRLFTPKRRRDTICNFNIHKSIKVNSNHCLKISPITNDKLENNVESKNSTSNNNHDNCNSPLKLLPIKLDTVPGSVLAPTWKPSELNESVIDTQNNPNVTNSHLSKTNNNNNHNNSIDHADECSVFSDNINTNTCEESLTNKNNELSSSASISSSISTSETDSTAPSPPHPPTTTNTTTTTTTTTATTASTSSVSNQGDSNVLPNVILLYFCEWEYCTESFELKQQVVSHVYNTHLPNKESRKLEGSLHLPGGHKYPPQFVRRYCRWRGCQSASIARAPFALMTHVLDLHCSNQELEHRRSVYQQSKSQNSNTEYMKPPLCDTPQSQVLQSDYPNDQSGWAIIRSVEVKTMQADLWAAHQHFLAANPHCHPNASPVNPPIHLNLVGPPREGPVTKHLRVTAALILRNIVTHLEEAREWMSSESPLLCEIAMGCSPNENGLRTNDASTIIAQCLSMCDIKKSCPVIPFLVQRNRTTDYIPSSYSSNEQISAHSFNNKILLSHLTVRPSSSSISSPLRTVDLDS